jgi:hypothetical protein
MKFLLTTLLLTSPLLHAAPKGPMPNPDFTKGEPIPEGATHDWTLGATGARGWMFSNSLETSQARQIRITKVDPVSPAQGILQPGDVILGIAGKPFSYDPRTEFGKALTTAETKQSEGKLSLIRWRDGKQENITIQLPVLGSYSATAPYDCEKSTLILQQGCANIAKRINEDPNYPRQNPISRSLNALALLASGNADYLPIIKKEAEWAAGFSDNNMATWYYGYVIAFLAEYKLATNDDSMLPGLRRLAMEAATGQSAVGSWGHKFAKPNGTLFGYGMMNAPGVSLTTSLVLARAAGVNDPEITTAIDRSLKLLRFYKGKGSIPYGDHNPWYETHDDNGKNGMAAVLFNLANEPEPTEYFSRMSLACHGAERDCGHTGNFWNMTWAMPGINPSGPNATGAWMQEFGAWSFDLARRPDGSFPHQGPPEPDGDSTRGWDATGAYLIAYAMPLKKIYLTGKKSLPIPQLSPDEAQSIILDGRGWSNNNRHQAYDSLDGDSLLERLSSWSPVVRERAAIALSRRKDIPIDLIIKFLDSEKLYTQLGACQALEKLRNRSAPAIPKLRELLHAKDLWLRIKAADTLAAIGKDAAPAVPEMLELLAKPTTPDDPRSMWQRYLTFALFSNRGGLVHNSLDQVDKQLLQKAITAGLKNQDGRARSTVSDIYQKLSYEDIQPILPAILEAINTPAPSGEMFADGVRIAGLQLLAKHNIEQGMPAALDYLVNQNQWSSENRSSEIMAIFYPYGTHAQKHLPALQIIADTFDKGEPSFPRHCSDKKVKAIRDGIEAIKAAKETPQLKTLTNNQ